MWVTYRYALLKLGMTDKEIWESEHILVHAPNGIMWTAYQVPDQVEDQAETPAEYDRTPAEYNRE